MKKNVLKKILLGLSLVVLSIAMVGISYAASRRIRQAVSSSPAGFDLKLDTSGKKVKVEKYNTISEVRDNMFKEGCELRISIPVFTSSDPDFASTLNIKIEDVCNSIMDELLVRNDLTNVNMYVLSKCDIKTVSKKKMVFWLKGKKTLYGGKTKNVKFKIDFNMEDGTMEWVEK